MIAHYFIVLMDQPIYLFLFDVCQIFSVLCYKHQSTVFYFFKDKFLGIDYSIKKLQA